MPEWLHGPYLGGAGWLLRRAFDELLHAPTGPGPPALLRALSVCQTKPVLYGAFVWARGALNGRKRRFPARAGNASGALAPRTQRISAALSSMATAVDDVWNRYRSNPYRPR